MDSKSTFVKRFGDLVALLRVDPANDAAQDLALTAACAAVETEPVDVEAGVASSVIAADLALESRLRARQVEAVHVAAGAEPHELLALARALSHDTVTIPSCPNVRVEMVRHLVPPPGVPAAPPAGGDGTGSPAGSTTPRHGGERRTWKERRRPGRGRYPGMERRRGADRRVSGERRLYLINGQRAEIERLHETLSRSARGLAWDAVLASALALVHLVPRLPSGDRRPFGIRMRRAIPRRAVESLVDLAEQDAGLRPRATEVLRWIGLDAAEIILERLAQGEALGVRGFYYEVLSGMPGAYPLVTPLLARPHPHEVRHGAALLGRLGQPAAIGELVPLMSHRDEGVRVAGVRAIGEIHEGPAAEPLRRALHHPDGRTRAAAAEAIAVWRGGALAPLLVPRLEAERDRDAWHALITSLGRIGSAEACAALAGVALTKWSLLRRQGYSTGQRLAAVEALGLSVAPVARDTLERLARDAEGVVRYAAGLVLQAERQRAG